MENKDKDLITISETAELLGVSIMTLRRWDKSGRLFSVRKKPGGNRYYRKEDIDVFLSDLFKLAKDWAVSKKEFPEQFYCQTSAIFQARITKMESLMKVAFTEIISGRKPEARGNGLKYVKNVIQRIQSIYYFKQATQN